MRDERALQLAYHRDADAEHLAWQTEGPYFAETEARLLDGVRAEAGERLLEIGCGEGANLHHLRHVEGRRVGIDFSFEKSHAARATGAHVACADATRLPFADQAFDVVLIRDLLHHVPARLDVLHEAHRVLRSGGRFHLIEPNARAPLVVLQALTVRAERGLLRSTERRLRDELEASGFSRVEFATAQPFPLARVLLHPRFGRPRLGERPVVRAALDRLDAALTHVVPRAAWLYLCFSAVRP
jgi:SAM-dependent methyltransferase